MRHDRTDNSGCESLTGTRCVCAAVGALGRAQLGSEER
jgi:hypothetical protein